MRELRLYRWCDFCHAEAPDTYVEAVTIFTVSITDGKRRGVPATRVVEMCERHGKEVTELWEKILELGALPSAIPNAPGGRVEVEIPAEASKIAAVDCPLCGHVYQRQTIIKHLISQHELAPVIQPRKCPDCTRTIPHQHGMRTHRRIAHDYDYVADVLAQAPRKRRGRATQEALPVG